MDRETLLRQVETFLKRHGMGATTLGKKAVNDAHFVDQLREGRRVWPETAQKVIDFMRERSAA